MKFLISREESLQAICDYLRAQVTEFNLVKPYHGELDRYSKKVQLKENIFPATVNLTTPFALVVSKNRERMTNQGASRKFRHEISVYVGDSNDRDFSSLAVPSIFSLMNKCAEALDGAVLLQGAGPLTVVSDGDYLITTDLFVVYDQKYYQLEIGN